MNQDTSPSASTVEPKPATITRAEAARIIGISRELWFSWERKGWMPPGSWAPNTVGGGKQKLYTHEEIEALRAAIERGEHPAARDRATPEHTLTKQQAADLLGITPAKWIAWQRRGLVPPGRRAALSEAMGLDASKHLWTPAQVEEARRKAQELGILQPPATAEHTVTREEAARRVGISVEMWDQWGRKGIVPAGRWAPHEKGLGYGGLRKLYTPADVRAVREALDALGVGRALNATPAHTISQREAARMLGVEASAWQKWERRGLVPEGAWGRSGCNALRKLYTPAQVEQAREALRAEGVRCFAKATPQHTLTRQEAARLIGVPWTTWHHWERQGRPPVGAWGPAAKGRGRCKLYTPEEIQEFAEQLRKEHEPYPAPDRPGCYRVPIRTHKDRMEAVIDADCLALVAGRNWNYSEGMDEYGYRGVVILSTTKARQTPLKQIVTGRSGPRWRIRHANGDFLDCRRGNLVVLDIAEQCRGSRKMRLRAGQELTSKYKGVCWCEERGKWLAQIRKEGVHHHLGRFDDEIDAALAYDRAACELFGEHARLNFADDAALSEAA
jgi:DNA-binding transcriptional MerR regulator/DNA-binding XRE family transcriptional regulator